MSTIIAELEKVIKRRKKIKPENSYTASLLKGSREKIWRKLNEETLELILASRQNKKRDIVYESGDVIYHLMVLLASHGIGMKDIYRELEKRRK